MNAKRWTTLTLAAALALSLAACGGSAVPAADKSTQEVTLYADFSCGSAEAQELDLIKTQTVSLEEVTPEALAAELTAWTGLDFTLADSALEEGVLTVDWSPDATLLAGLDDREQKEDFFFHDNVTLDWFMLDSLYRTLTENLDVEEVYYTMDGGQDLTVYELYPVGTFPADIPYMGSPFYYAHSDNVGEEDPSMMSDPGDTPLYAATEGTWYLNGDENGPSLVMDGVAGFTMTAADGTVTQGYLDAVDEYGDGTLRYDLFDLNNQFLAGFYLDSDTQLHFGNDDSQVYTRAQ